MQGQDLVSGDDASDTLNNQDLAHGTALKTQTHQPPYAEGLRVREIPRPAGENAGLRDDAFVYLPVHP